MSTYDDASLVFYPSGYKTSVLYSEKPMDANGQLTFTRASNATRVAPNGLIEEVRTNLLLHSQDPSNAVWTKTNTTYSGDTLTAVGGLNSKYLFQAQAQQGLQTIYFDLAYVSHQFFQVFHVSGAGDVQFANFDILNKVVATTGGGAINATLQDFGTFVRIALVLSTTTKTTCALAFVDSGSATRGASSASTGSVKVFRAQNEVGDIATNYIATTTSARSTFAGITVNGTSVPNVPRIDYTGGGCGKLLLEPQRTNICLWSENFNNAAWGKTNAIVTANSVTSPDGYLNADLLQSLSSTEPRIRQTTTQTGIAAFTFSCFAKKGNVDFLILRNIAVNSAGGSRAWFNLNTGVVGTVNAGLTASMVSYGNGWYRCVISGTTEALPTNLVDISLSATDNSISGSAIGSNIYIYGAQLEAGAYATSYINTLSTSVTRVADVASKASISSLLGGTEGTLMMEVDYRQTAAAAVLVFGAFNGIGGALGFTSSGSNTMRVRINSVNDIIGSVNTSIRHKVALAFNASGVVCYVNGSPITLPNGGSQVVSGLDEFILQTSTRYNELEVYQVYYSKTRLSNSTLARLTQL